MNFINHRCATPEEEEKKEMSKYLEERKTEPYDKAFTFVYFFVQVYGYIQNSDDLTRPFNMSICLKSG